ncbi:MAG: hypothetical protein KF893_10715 [Caldilineaceae bacterium]|nr:hypothetical protein [Caldilineaceae bacterium]
MSVVEERVLSLEEIMKELAYAQLRTEMELNRLSSEMRDFKQEMSDFKEQTRADRVADRREWNKRWGELANRLGTIVEDIVAPNLPRIAQEYFGVVEISDFITRRKVRVRTDEGLKEREFDSMVVGKTASGQELILLNETKAYVRQEYLERFVQVLGELDDYLPEYRGKPIIPIFASLSLDESEVNYLTRKGIYAMAMGDETMDLLNYEQVRGLELR